MSWWRHSNRPCRRRVARSCCCRLWMPAIRAAMSISRQVDSVLKEIGADHISQLRAFSNKIDLLELEPKGRAQRRWARQRRMDLRCPGPWAGAVARRDSGAFAVERAAATGGCASPLGAGAPCVRSSMPPMWYLRSEHSRTARWSCWCNCPPRDWPLGPPSRGCN